MKTEEKNAAPTGIVADIERFSAEDGPGIRTVVFLKGCPLRCAWCHNPECIAFGPQELYYPEKCIGCGQCASGCYAGARVPCGRRMTVDEVMAEVREDAAYYGTDGGLTLSGGEPLAQPEFSAALLTAAREAGIGTAVETSLCLYHEDVLRLCGVIMTDVKIYDADLHRRYTGRDNGEILANLRRADGLGIPLIVRTPVIPGVNDTAENIGRTAEFLRTLKNVVRYELLPYHPLGNEKAKALGLQRPVFAVPEKEKMEELKRYADIR